VSLAAGTRLGPYEIHSALGGGGIEDVDRARDTKLGRDVAIKVLPDAFASDPERLARFERETRTLASLNQSAHRAPARARGFGRDARAGHGALDGEDLAERIRRGPIPLEEALTIANRSGRRSKPLTNRASSIAI
jgi:serine/threonine protein kinase